MAVQHTWPLRAEYIWEAPDDNRRYEVIDGVLYVSAAPSHKHQRVLLALASIMRVYAHPRRLGEVNIAPFGVVLDALTGVEPDLVYISRARRHLRSDRGVEGAPDLVVEVLSSSTRHIDRGIKMQRYARAAIPHYWIIDPLAETLEAYELVAGAYVQTSALRDDDNFSPAVLRGLTFSLAELWEDPLEDEE